MKINRTILIGILIIILAFGAGWFWRWVQGTPQYALYQIGVGLKNRNLNTSLAYVDVESILDQQLSGIISNLLSSLTASDSLTKITGPLGEIKIKLTPQGNKSLSQQAIRQLQTYLENPKNPTLPSALMLLTLADFKVKGNYALVTITKDKDQLRMGMQKQEGLWRVKDLNPEDTQRLIKKYFLPPQK
jgi:hypothetical protein